MGVHFRQVGGARALQIPRRLGRLGFGASTDRAGQVTARAAADLLRPGTPNSVEIDTYVLKLLSSNQLFCHSFMSF